MRPETFQSRWNVSHETFSRLLKYHDLLLKWQKAINLISPKTIDEAWERHFADSAQMADLIPAGFQIVADVGSGGGFPGMVLGILNPTLKMHLIESDQRKCEFLKIVSHETSAGATIHNKRAEIILAQINPEVITARAFASLKEILALAIPCAEKNANLQLVLLKGKGTDLEIAEASRSFLFNVKQIPSATDKDARILVITDLRKKIPS